jgi:branched-subunit amino acid transport protein
MTTWTVILAVGVGTYVLRVLPLFVGERYLSSPRAERIISHAGTAAFAALIASGLDRSIAAGTDAVATWLCAAAALFVALRGGSMLRVLGAGAITYAAAWSVLALLS